MDKDFTIKELEILAQAYLDCRLSLLQEKELELVLYNTELSSPLIDEARQTMGIIARMGGGKQRRSVKLKWYSAMSWAAACVGVVMLTSLFFFSGKPISSHTGEFDYIAVYVDGKKLSGREAMVEADRSQADNMAMMSELLADAQADNMQNMKYLKY